ncbi:MAG: 23S rRNA (uracil(1939)-C(5))-methyltransferase RlmD [Candidatus Berkiella sp.]
MSRNRKLVNQSLELTVNQISVEGRGISSLDGKKVFVFGALENEKVQAKVIRQHSRYLETKLESVLEASEKRVEPICPHFGECGGCQMQHLSTEHQIEHKQKQLSKLLAHAEIVPSEWHETLTGPSTGYRYKARLGVRYVEKKGVVLVGFREAHSNKIVEMNSCAILHPVVGNLIDPLRQLVSELAAFKDIPQIEVAAGDKEVALIFRILQPLIQADIDKLIAFSSEHHLSLYLQEGGPESVKKIWPNQEETLSYRLMDGLISMHFKPLDFTQINPVINNQMVRQALDWLQVSENDTVLDLFCGLGNFTLPLAQKAKAVVGVEGDAQMTAKASMNAVSNQISNASFYEANLFEDCSKAPWFTIAHNKVLLDPPRLGAAAIVDNIEKLAPESILYVSCDMNTFVRDAAVLVHQKKYKLEKVAIMDMFPHTKHVETMGLFVLKK